MASVAWTLAAGQPPQQIAIDGAEQQFAALGALARAGDVIEDPGDLGAGEIGIDDQAGLGRDRGSRPSLFSCAQMSAVRRSCQTMARCTALPVARSQTTVVSRWLVMPIAAMSFGGEAAPSSAPRGRSRPSRSRYPPARARPSRRPENAAGIRLARWRRSRCRREIRSRARMWCPDRWPARTTWCCFPGGVCAKASGLGLVRQYGAGGTYLTSSRLRGEIAALLRGG